MEVYRKCVKNIIMLYEQQEKMLSIHLPCVTIQVLDPSSTHPDAG